MNFSETFIRRPVATVLLTLAVALAGAVAFRLLPVAPLPQVDFPTILVNANMAGASPEIMGSAVATPLERVLGRIAGVTEMTSTSSLGSTSIVLQFDIDRDIDGAARDVQAAINAARSLLPTDLSNNPTYRKVNPADAPVMILALSSPTMKRGDIYDVASTILAQKLSQILGVGQVLVGGGALPAVRVDLNPDALARNGIALESVRTALASSNANRPKGTVEEGERSWQIGANDQARKAAEYLPLIIGYRNGAAVRLSEVAQVTDSVEDVRNAGFSNGKPAVLVILFRQPGANIIETVDRVREALPGLQASLPGAVDMRVVMDRTPTIRASLREVERSLAISVCLVVLVVFLFLRNGRATLIPSVAVPVSLIGTFGIMYLCDYSLDNLSLMALTIATGFVVDDAIVVLENISRHIEDGMTPFRAAVRGAREVGFTVLSISLSLVAVFIPILLMGGIVGRMFREFAVTLSAAIMVSLLVSLTTTPMLCAHFLRGRGPEREEGRFHAFTGRLLGALQGGYAASLAFALRHRRLTICCLAATVAFNVYLYVVVPKGFFPQQDTGRVSGSIQADQSISFQAMRGKLLRLMDTVRQDPAVEEVAGFTGGSERNGGRVFISLKPLSERGVSIDGFIGRIRGKLMREPGAALLLQGAQDVRVGGRQSRAQYQYTLQSDDLAALRLWTARLEQALKPLPILADVNSDQQDRGLQTTVAVDRDKASRLGVTMRQVDAALNDAFGQRLASTIYTERNQYRVVMEVNPAYLENPDGLLHVHVPGASGELVPLNSFAEFKPDLAPLAVNHQGQSAAATVSFNIRPGASLSDVTRAIEEARQRIGMPESVHGGFQGTARVFQDSLRTQPWLILAALVSLYIVLGVLYESYIHPVTILSTLPSAGVGALLALMACGTEFSIIALIGVLLLAGIVKKNAIMMIDFAIDAERREGLDPEAAITRACLLRFRPIMMTTMAALFGALPLALGAGDGAELRRPLGIAIVGGLAMSQLLTLYTTPVVYLYLDRFRLWCKGFWRAFQPRVAPSGPHAAGDGTPPNP